MLLMLLLLFLLLLQLLQLLPLLLHAASWRHLQSLLNISACTLAYLLCFPPPCGAHQTAAEHACQEHGNRALAQAPAPDQVALDAILSQPTKTTATHVPAVAFVAVTFALMPFFRLTSRSASNPAACPGPVRALLSAYTG